MNCCKGEREMITMTFSANDRKKWQADFKASKWMPDCLDNMLKYR